MKGCKQKTDQLILLAVAVMRVAVTVVAGDQTGTVTGDQMETVTDDQTGTVTGDWEQQGQDYHENKPLDGGDNH